MLVVGIGIGLVMQVLVLVVQNDAPPRDIGVATSTATFFRSMGGSLGVALFGAIFASRLGDELKTLPGRRRRALRRRREHLARRRCTRCPPRSATTSCSRSSTRCSRCSSSAPALTAVAFVLAWLLKEVPLRATLEEAVDVAAPGRAIPAAAGVIVPASVQPQAQR